MSQIYGCFYRRMCKSGDPPGYVAALDVGTTTIRCQIINSLTETVGAAYSAVSKVLFINKV